MRKDSFDEVSRELAKTTDRRTAIKLMTGAVAGGALSLMGLRPASADDPGRCRKVGVPCRRSSECCSSYCDPTTARCACAPGTNFCPKTGICIAQCFGGTIFNPETCKCECPAGATTCTSPMGFNFCCAGGGTCCDFSCCPSGTTCCGFTCCLPGTQCCTSPFFGRYCSSVC